MNFMLGVVFSVIDTSAGVVVGLMLLEKTDSFTVMVCAVATGQVAMIITNSIREWMKQKN